MNTKTKAQKQTEFDRLIELYHETMYDLKKDLQVLGEYEYRTVKLSQKLYSIVKQLGNL